MHSPFLMIISDGDPKGADAIIMVEDTSGFSNNDYVKVMISVSSGSHIRKTGEEINEEVVKKDPNIEGFNLGTNVGKVSGQSILHCHFHLIPRRSGDVENPQGGVRSVIPNKQHYKRK